MDPIQPKSTPNIQPPQLAEAKSASEATQKFTLNAATPAVPTTTAQPTHRPVFDGLATQIQNAVGRSLTREQVRDEVIGEQAKQAFGESATPAMATAIGEAFKSDPHLSQLFNQLYAQAVAKQT